MLAPFPYRDADRMVFPRIYDTQQGPEIGRQGYSAAEVLEFVENNHVFDATTAALGELRAVPGIGPEPSRSAARS